MMLHCSHGKTDTTVICIQIDPFRMNLLPLLHNYIFTGAKVFHSYSDDVLFQPSCLGLFEALI